MVCQTNLTGHITFLLLVEFGLPTGFFNLEPKALSGTLCCYFPDTNNANFNRLPIQDFLTGQLALHIPASCPLVSPFPPFLFYRLPSLILLISVPIFLFISYTEEFGCFLILLCLPILCLESHLSNPKYLVKVFS